MTRSCSTSTPIGDRVLADGTLRGIRPVAARTYGDTVDFARLRWFVATGRGTPTDVSDAIKRAVHDANVTFDLGAIIAGRRVVGIMGGHRLPRGSMDYRRVAGLARDLAGRNMLVCTGGGPGAMEAAHVGASLARHPDDRLDRVIDALATVPEMPDLRDIVGTDGGADPRCVRAAGGWFAPAWRESRLIVDPVPTLSIPTWHFGHEPTSPFATHVVKLFQNSIREDGLLTVARQGIVFTRGSAGTLQEIFQDAQQNFYARHPDYFSPMVFLDRDYWTRELPIVPLLDALFATAEPAIQAEAKRLILVTDDLSQVAEHLDCFSGPESRLARP